MILLKNNTIKGFVIGVILTLLVTGTVLAVASSNIVGDIIGSIFHTDIVTYFNGAKINSFNINGQTAIVAEDLRDYGFDVTWNGEKRELHVAGRGENSVSEALRNEILDFTSTGFYYLGKMDFYKRANDLHAHFSKQYNSLITIRDYIDYPEELEVYSKQIIEQVSQNNALYKVLKLYYSATLNNFTEYEKEKIEEIIDCFYQISRHQEAAIESFNDYYKYKTRSYSESYYENYLKSGDLLISVGHLSLELITPEYYTNYNALYELIGSVAERIELLNTGD